MKKDVYELTNPQKSIWLTEEFYKGTAINNICGNLIIREKIDFEKFIKAINLFVKTNESFRLKFFVDNSIPKQYVSDFSEFDLEIIDVKSDDEILKLQKETASEVFEVLDSLLFKFKIVRLPDGSGGFIINAHHLISDAATFAILATEIVKIYSSLINDTQFEYNTNLYTDYIKSEQEYLQSEKFKKDEAYWSELYKEIPEVATVPSLLNKNEKNSNNSLREDFIIPKELFDKINVICKENRISSYNLFMAIYSIYLGRVSNLDEFVIGTPILNRTNFVEKNTSGMFISTAPFKISLNHELSFADFVKKIATDSLSMLRHQKYPYQFLLENLRKQNGNVPNLYDFMFSYQITKAVDKTIDVPYTTHWLGTNTIANSIEIHTHDNDSNGTVTIGYDYKIEKYTKEDINNLHARILCMLEQIISNPNILLKNIEIVTPEEKNKILYEFNNTKVDYPKDKTIVQLFEEQVEKTPDNIAVVFEDQKLTYKELNEKANQLAWYLRKQGVEQKNIIGIHLEKNTDYVVSIFAVLKLGCIFMPISTSYPKDRISYMIENSNANLVISEQSLIKRLDLDFLFIDINSLNSNTSNSDLNLSLPYDNPIYVLYTSGSTGNPKGVIINNYSLVNHVYGINEKFDNTITNSDIALSVANISFDANIQEIFIPLIFGASLHLLKNDAIYDINYLANYIVNNKITFSFIPPSILEDIYELIKNNKNVCLNKLLVGVESISNLTLNKYLNINPNMKIHNGYGPTEATICCISYMYQRNNSNSFVPIGTPLQNTNIYILNSISKRIQPFGTPGEIYISGDCLSSGYINNLMQTKNNFVHIPYVSDDIFYKTGDYAYSLPDGNIMFVGRKDSQVKLRGHRIELNEINSIIQNYIGVKQSATIIYDKKQIISYITSTDNVNIAELKSHLESRLPKYMLPSHIIELSDIPYTSNGKIDFKKLESLNFWSNKSENIILPKNDIEEKLLNILSKLFVSDKISTDCNIFDMGADSLFAIKLSSYIKNELSTDINVVEIFNNPTIIKLANIIDSKKKNNSVINKANLTDFYPVSSAQKRIYYSSKVADNGNAYNMPGALILSETPDIESLENCFNKLIEKHETLRTYFEVIGGEVVQKIKEKINFKIDFAEEICTDKYSSFTNFVKPFDLSKAPLLRAKLVKLEKNQNLLLFDMHHIISDGTSMQILINELCKLYNGESISPLEITYKDYSVWEQNNLKENKLNKSQKFWVNQFKDDDIPVLNLPTNYPRPTVQSFEGSNIYKELDKNLTEKLNTLAKELNITPYMLLLSCYYILLYKYTSNEDIIVGTPIVGRESSQTNDIIGMFVNSLPLRKKLNSNESFLEFSKSVKEMCLNAFEHQTYPFDELVNKLNIKRDSSRNPLFDTMFIYQNEGNTKVNLGNIKSTYYIPDNNISKFDLSLEVVPENNKLNLRFEYATKLFNKEFIEYLSTHYINILNAVLENTDIKIADIDMLSEEEKHKILYEFNNTKVDYPKDKTIVELFEEQVEKTPDNIAVVFEEQKLTYRELNEKANQLAYKLIINNIKSNDIVGVLLPRSLDLIISIWGILKVGAGYMLIDDKLPNERINYMLKNAEAKALITYKDFKNIKYNTLYIDNFKLENTKNLNFKLSNENNLAVIYTSGSTGEPKGVLLKQCGLKNLLLAYQTILNTNICTNFLCTSAVSFDMFMVETFIPILSGKTIILANDDERQIPTYTSKLIEKRNVHFILTTPSKMDLLLTPNFSSCLKDIKVIQLGGEVFTNSLYDKLSKVTYANIYNGYGPTEITACCSSKKVTNSEDITIGKPICNTQILVLDKDNNLCPIDVPGELCVIGDGVSKGYINNIDATIKTFIKTKYSDLTAYKTGDIAKFNKNGELVYIGRNDTQIKIRGLRIELSEIENKLLNIEKIEKCAVIYKKEPKNPHIVAFFTASKTLEIADIRKSLSEVLPIYMVPKYIVQIDSMPITSNGKLNNKELSNLEIDVSDTNYIAPKTDNQKLFCRILEELLNVKVGITDDLFELGLDSLIAIKFKVELMNHNIDISYANIFKYHTVKELCDNMVNKNESISINDYDYDGINKVLSKNVFRNNINIKTNTNNNILLLGATGFVGAHILKSFIEKDKGNVYCIVRDKNNTSAKERFLSTLHFYFGNKLDKYIDKRIFILKGNLLKENFELSNTNINMLKENISIIINSAAKVKHYGNSKEFTDINVKLIENLIAFCKENNKRLLHISSLSISENIVFNNNISKMKNTNTFSEKNLYIGQPLDNVYIRSKFMAERLILDNINLGLDAQILRLGNITNRYSDGAFQINPQEHAFLSRISSFIKIHSIPQNILNTHIDYTPVDYCGEAIILIMQNHVKNYSVFHLYNHYHLYVKNLVSILNSINIEINILTVDSFSELVISLLKNPQKKNYLSGIVNDLSSDKKLNYKGNVNVKSDFSIQFLEKIGFVWPKINKTYIIKYIKYLIEGNFI